jgi:hypothetical protein
MPRRLVARSVQPTQFPQLPELKSEKFAEGRINLGMITMIDPADLPTGALQLAKNATVRFDKTARRSGSILLVPEKPDANPVLKLAFIKKKDGTGYTIRMTPTSLHVRGGVAWTPIVGAGLAGTIKDRFQTAVVLDEFIFANNGADPIQRVDFVGNTYAQLGNAPAYRYITGFYNRAVGFARRGVNEIELGWSADGVATEWNPATNESAGSAPILESPSDLSDFGTGLFSFSNVMVLLRERSLWIATKQPIAQNPFYVTTAVPNIGCDSPYSACLIDNAVAFMDRRTGTVYAWTPGSPPEPIGRPIENEILKNINDPATIFSSYESVPGEYSLYIPQVGSNYVVGWTYNRRGKAWSKNEYYAITMVEDTDLATGGVTIDGLGDVPIDELVGTIDDLSPDEDIVSTRVFGRSDGTIAQNDFEATTDAPVVDFPAGAPYTTQLVSKVFSIPEDDLYIAKIVIEYQSNRGGEFLLEYSKNGGATETSWKTAKVVNPAILGEPRLITFKKFIRCRRFAWRLTTTSGLFETLAYEVHVYPAGESKNDTR